MSDKRWISRVHGLIRDADGGVLVLVSDDSATLPYAEIEGYADFELSKTREAFASLVGVDTVAVRPVARTADEESRVLDIALELELLEPRTASRPEVDWLAPGDSAWYSLPARDRELLERLFADEPPPERAPWARPGWFAEAAGWIEGSLAELGRPAIGPVEQVSSWCISSILRVPTATGNVFFKATARSPLFVDEGAVTRGLAGLLPENVPLPIALDADRRWMLLDDFGPPVGWKAPLETQVEVLTLFARLQLETSGRIDELMSLGALDRRLAWLAAQIESLPRAPGALGLDDEELERLDALVPDFVDSCARLAAGAVPDTLVHGDLHLDNVARGDGTYVFFDWTDACVTHPFLDLIAVIFEENRDLRHALQDAYLSVWEKVASREDLLELWRLAEPLAALNQAVSYRHILENVEPGTVHDLESMLPYFVRKALAAHAER